MQNSLLPYCAAAVHSNTSYCCRHYQCSTSGPPTSNSAGMQACPSTYVISTSAEFGRLSQSCNLLSQRLNLLFVSVRGRPSVSVAQTPLITAFNETDQIYIPPDAGDRRYPWRRQVLFRCLSSIALYTASIFVSAVNFHCL